MYHHIKKLMFTVRVDEPDPSFGIGMIGPVNTLVARALGLGLFGLSVVLFSLGTHAMAFLPDSNYGNKIRRLGCSSGGTLGHRLRRSADAAISRNRRAISR